MIWRRFMNELYLWALTGSEAVKLAWKRIIKAFVFVRIQFNINICVYVCPALFYFFLWIARMENSKSLRLITKINDHTICIANLHSLEYKLLSLHSRVYISPEIDHKNLETLRFSRRHQRVHILRFTTAHYSQKGFISSPELWHFLAFDNDIGVKGGPLSRLSLKCASSRYQGSVGGL